MPQKLFLYGTDSRCCGCPSLVVQSRPGGFVTQNCTCCGTPRALGFRELPTLSCGRCETPLTPLINQDKNYSYRCESCGVEWELAALVPFWDELFDYIGYGLDSDDAPVTQRDRLSPAEFQEMLARLRRWNVERKRTGP